MTRREDLSMRTWKYHLIKNLRRLYVRLSGRNCDTCRHYDGRFGEDCCFQCERNIKAVNYDRE